MFQTLPCLIASISLNGLSPSSCVASLLLRPTFVGASFGEISPSAQKRRDGAGQAKYSPGPRRNGHTLPQTRSSLLYTMSCLSHSHCYKYEKPRAKCMLVPTCTSVHCITLYNTSTFTQLSRLDDHFDGRMYFTLRLMDVSKAASK